MNEETNALTVDKLRKLLSSMPGDIPVIIQADPEGNRYSPLYAVDCNAVYDEETPVHGEVWSTDWSAEEAAMAEEEWKAFKRSRPRCCVLAPAG